MMFVVMFLYMPVTNFSPGFHFGGGELQPRHHNIDSFLRHHIIVNIFSTKKKKILAEDKCGVSSF